MNLLERRQAMTWVCIRADEVVAGDLYANGSTVTKSRRAKGAEGSYINKDGARDLWHIKCGKSFSHTLDRDSPIVVGRRALVVQPSAARPSVDGAEGDA